MATIGEAYTIQLSKTPTPIVWRNALARGAIVQPQGADLGYRLDGKPESLNGFVLSDLAITTLHTNALVVWAARGSGRLVIQEITDKRQ